MLSSSHVCTNHVAQLSEKFDDEALDRCSYVDVHSAQPNSKQTPVNTRVNQKSTV